MRNRPVEAAHKKVAKSTQRLKLAGYPDQGFLCFSSVLKQIRGDNWKRGTTRLPQLLRLAVRMTTLSKSQKSSSKSSHPF
jgi:hypothetical protein